MKQSKPPKISKGCTKRNIDKGSSLAFKGPKFSILLFSGYPKGSLLHHLRNLAFSCFFEVRKAFDTVWTDGLMYKLFYDFGVKGNLWLAIKDLYTDVKARVLYSGALSREFEIAQGTGQRRILAPFTYKVYINSLLKELSGHCFAISINTLRMPAPSFADDICLIALHQSLLKY